MRFSLSSSPINNCRRGSRARESIVFTIDNNIERGHTRAREERVQRIDLKSINVDRPERSSFLPVEAYRCSIGIPACFVGN